MDSLKYGMKSKEIVAVAYVWGVEYLTTFPEKALK
jgi:hypothetical protein